MGVAGAGWARNVRVLAKARLSPIPLGSLPNQLFLLSDERSGSIAFAMLRRASLFPYSHPYPARVLAKLG